PELSIPSTPPLPPPCPPGFPPHCCEPPPLPDTVNGFAFHPCLPLAATSSGHRRFHLPPPLTPASPPEADSHAPEVPAVSPDEGHVFLESTVADVHNTLDRLH
ncbi:unnamed protein product, partial [Closterium sp. NIES-54]